MPPDNHQIEEAHSWGKMGPGRRFHKLAADLDRAWAACRMTAHERRVLQFVREHSWGDSAIRGDDPRPCDLSPARLGRLWRIHRQHVFRAIASLVSDRMLLKEDDGYLVGKDAAAWPDTRITPHDRRYAIVGDALDVTELGYNPVTNPGYKSSPSVTDPGYVRNRTGLQGEPNSVTDGPAPYRNAGASEDLRLKKINQDRGREGVSPGAITEPIPAGPLPPTLPAVETPEQVDARLAAWVRAKVSAALADPRHYPGLAVAARAAVADDFADAVAGWRSVGVPRHHVAAIVNDFFSWQARKVEPANHLGYVRAIFRNRKEGQDIPACPPEWKPAPVSTRPAWMDDPAHLARIAAARERIYREGMEKFRRDKARREEEARRKAEEFSGPAFREFAETMRLAEQARRDAILRGVAS